MRSSPSRRISAPVSRPSRVPSGSACTSSAPASTSACSPTATATSPSRALGWDADGPRVAHVGNLVPAKNLAQLLAAFAVARTAWGGGSLALVGDGPQRAELERLAGSLGVGGSVRFAGAVPPAQVPRWLRACDVACLVSQREGFGLAAIEALACGRPVLVARGVPAGSAVTEGVTGELCDPGDLEGMAAALVRAAALAPGASARVAAEPYSLMRETARAVAELERCVAARR